MTPDAIGEGLKPCPFCGGRMVKSEHHDHLWSHPYPSDCYLQFMEVFRNGEVEAWNRRAAQPTILQGEGLGVARDYAPRLDEPVKGGCVVAEIAAERRRQIEAEGWTPQHDDRVHDQGGLACAGAAYALHAGYCLNPNRVGFFSPPPNCWPFDEEWWKPKTPRRDLVRAAALIIAEIERLDRATEPPK